MKVIDLLNKIANGEEVPEKIKYLGIEFSFQHNCIEYINDYGTCLIRNISSKSLNDKVEVIEDTPKEDKKIEKIKDYIIFKTMGLDCEYHERKEPKNYSLEEKEIVDKINEIIDKINGEN
jgi:hypothetical protein